MLGYFPRPDDEVRSLREDADCVPGVMATQRRICTHAMRLYPAFGSLEVMDIEAALEFIERPLKAAGLPKGQYEKVLPIILYFGTVTVEAERERVRRLAMPGS